jgi:hypothetical protein
MMGLGLAALLGGCVTTALLLPTAVFTFSPTSGESPLNVLFDASDSQAAPGGTIVEFAWDFGDGTAGQGKITSHSYETAVEQVFQVMLRVTDSLGQQVSITAQLTVRPAVVVTREVSVEFVWPFHFDASGDDAVNLNDEYFTLQNTGDDTTDLSGWTVENERGVRFRFPNGVLLMPNAVLTVHSGSGSNTTSIFYWHSAEPIWNNDYDLAILRDSSGLIVTIYPIISC